MVRTEERNRIFLAACAPLKPLVLSWVVVVLFATMAYALEAASPSLGQTDWKDAARAGSSLWMLALGSPFIAGEATITLPPLLITALIAWWMFRELRRGVILEWRHVFIAAASSLFGTAILGYFSLPGTVRPVGAVCCAAVTCVAALHAFIEPSSGRFWTLVSQAYAFLRPLLRLIAILALVLTTIALLANRERIADINGYYVLDLKSTLMFAVAQLLYAPTYLIWAVGYIVGSGFSIGTGTLFSPFGVQAEALPAVPVFGALPSPGISAPWLPFLLAALLFLWGLRRSRQFSNGRHALSVVSVMFGFVLLLSAGLGLLAGGSIAQGRMHTVGTEVGSTILAYSLVIGAGHGLGVIAPFAARWLRRDLVGEAQEYYEDNAGTQTELHHSLGEDNANTSVTASGADAEKTKVSNANDAVQPPYPSARDAVTNGDNDAVIAVRTDEVEGSGTTSLDTSQVFLTNGHDNGAGVPTPEPIQKDSTKADTFPGTSRDASPEESARTLRTIQSNSDKEES